MSMELKMFGAWILVCLAWEISRFYEAFTEDGKAPFWVNALAGILSYNILTYFFTYR